MKDISLFVPSSVALEILSTVGERPTANRQLLKLLVDAGKIKPVKVNCRKFLYDQSEVTAVARAKCGRWGLTRNGGAV